MSFMEPQMTDKLLWLRGDHCTEGVSYRQASELTIEELLFDFDGAEIEELWGYGVRASAAGYMDCTEWSVYRNKRAAVKAYNQLARELRAGDAA